MSLGLIGKKIGMTQVYLEDGEALPVTVIQVAGNQVVQLKRKETDGYAAVQLGFDDKKESRVSEPLLGHFKKNGATPKYKLHEFRVEEDKLPEAGATFGPELFPAGTLVDVTGTTMGKGFQGVVRRFRFKGQPASHGSMMHRRPGSIGCRLTPGLVWKNKRMPGRMGGDRRTIQNLEVVQSRAEDGVLVIKGNVPGATNSYLIIRPAIKLGAVAKKNRPKETPKSAAATPAAKAKK
jgi:large subunit ribosomal protein L3